MITPPAQSLNSVNGFDDFGGESSAVHNAGYGHVYQQSHGRNNYSAQPSECYCEPEVDK